MAKKRKIDHLKKSSQDQAPSEAKTAKSIFKEADNQKINR